MGRRRAVPLRRRRARRIVLLGGLVVVHVGLIGGWQALPGDQPEIAGVVAPPLLEEAEGAEVRAGTVPRPGVVPVIRPDEPSGPRIPQRGAGTYAVAPAARTDAPSGAVTYRVEVERGLPFTAREFARAVDRTLGDRRSWAARTGRPMVRVGGEADLRIVLASPDTTDRLCAPLDTRGKVSCRNGEDVVINALRWARGAASYGDDVAAYRIYVVNHEVGHGLGQGHVGCTGPGDPAPVMLQQTLGLQGCRPNPWPTSAEVD